MLRGITLLFLLFIQPALYAQTEQKKIRFTLGKPGRYVIFPLLVKSPEYLWGAGVGGTVYFKLRGDSSIRTSNIKAVSFYTLRRQIVVASEGNIYLPGERYILHIVASFTRFPDKFWGLGNDTQNEALEKYAIRQYDIFPQIIRKTFSRVYAGVGYEFQNVFDFDYNRNGQSLFDTEDISGRNGGKTSGVGFILSWDGRNNAFSPSKGLFVQYYLGQYDKLFGSDFNFVMHNIDVRKFFPLKKDRVIAFELNFVSTRGDVPIRNLATMGSSAYMRGYYDGRYTDKNLIAIQSEFRTHLFGNFGGVLFAGAGKVGSSLPQLFGSFNLKPCAGIGLRYVINKQEKLNFRVDAGFGKKSNGTYFNIGEAF